MSMTKVLLKMSIQTKDNHVLISKTMEKDPEGIIEVFEVALSITATSNSQK